MGAQANILLIITEQHRGDCLGVDGHPVLLTPNIDAIAHNGVRFRRFYSACPSCIGARRCILSGQDPATTGMVGYAGGYEWFPQATLAQVLRDHGYQTRWIGRSMHQYPERKRYGYEEMELGGSTDSDYGEWLAEHAPADSGGWFGGGVMHNDWTARPWHLDEHLHATNWTVSRALAFMRRRDPSCPFFLTLSFIGSHPPLQPPAFYLERYLRTGVPDPMIGDWATRPDPAAGGDTVAPNGIVLEGEALLSTRAAYYGLLNHIDDQLRRLINGVIGLRQRDDTVICLTSDHGEMLGDHYLWRKSVAYEGSARIPFVLSAPERFGIGPGKVTDEPATHADIMPTLLELANIEIPPSCDGHSLVPLMRGDMERGPRTAVHIEHAPMTQALTDGRKKYLWDPRTGSEQLFNLDDDPHELMDLAADRDCAPECARWRERLAAQLQDRPEGFVQNGRLVPGRPYGAALPHCGGKVPFSRKKFV